MTDNILKSNLRLYENKTGRSFWGDVATDGIWTLAMGLNVYLSMNIALKIGIDGWVLFVFSLIAYWANVWNLMRMMEIYGRMKRK